MKPFFCASILSTWISLWISWRCIAHDYHRKYLTWLNGKSIRASSWSFHPPTTLERILTWSPRSKRIRARISNWESRLSTSLTWVTRSNAHSFIFFLELSSQIKRSILSSVDLTWLSQINPLISSWPSKVSARAAKRNLGMADLILCTSCYASPLVRQRIWPWRNIRSIPQKSQSRKGRILPHAES